MHLHLFPPEVTGSIERYTTSDLFLQQICSSKGHKFATVEDLLGSWRAAGLRWRQSTVLPQMIRVYAAMNDYVLDAARRYRSVTGDGRGFSRQPGFEQKSGAPSRKERLASVNFSLGSGFPLEEKRLTCWRGSVGKKPACCCILMRM